jgi:deoxyxylulose-5-phosphate synthase
VTLHNVVFCILNKKTKAHTVYAGSFHGKVYKMENVLDGGIEITISLRNAHAVEPVSDSTAAKLPATYSRVIVLEDGVTRVVRFLLHKSVTHDNLKIGSVCKSWCQEDCEYHMLRNPTEIH